MIVGAGQRTQRIVLVAGSIVLLILAFYGGRAYQNNIDQKLFNEYNPPTTGARGSAFGGGSGGLGSGGSATGSGSLVNTALGVGSPPGTTSGAGSNGTGSSSSLGFGRGSAGGARRAQANRISGTLASISTTTMSVTSVSGLTQSVALGHGTHFYQNKTALASDLKPRSQVTILASGSGNQLTAASITIGSQTVAGGGRRSGGAGRNFGSSRSVTTIEGKIARVSALSITVRGHSAAIAIASTTRIRRVVSIRASQLASGSFVTVSVATVGGSQVATSVVTRTGGSGASGPGG